MEEAISTTVQKIDPLDYILGNPQINPAKMSAEDLMKVVEACVGSLAYSLEYLLGMKPLRNLLNPTKKREVPIPIPSVDEGVVLYHQGITSATRCLFILEYMRERNATPERGAFNEEIWRMSSDFLLLTDKGNGCFWR